MENVIISPPADLYLRPDRKDIEIDSTKEIELLILFFNCIKKPVTYFWDFRTDIT